MTMNRWIACLLLLAGLPLAPAQPDGSATALANVPEAEPALQAYVDGVVDAMMREHGIPGMTVAVTDAERDRLVQGYGRADAAGDRAVDGGDTLFRIGSVSKTFTWTAVMMLVDRGQLDLDRDVNEFLVDFRIEPAFDAPVTMNDLMAHRAGFEDTLRVFQLTDDDPRSLAQVLAETQPARVFPAGTRTSYSNWGSALAAHIVELVDGRPYAEFLEAEILRPLGMDSTTILAPALLDAGRREQMAQGLEWARGRLETGEPMQIGAMAPAGAMASTAFDMARWMRFHLNGGALGDVRLMSEASHARMLRRNFNDRPGAADLAHGFQTFPLHGVTVFGHGGATAHFQTRMLFVPELDFGVFVSQNSASGGYAAANALTELLIEHAARAAGRTIETPQPPIGSVPEPNAHAGAYRNNRRSHETMTAVFSIAPTLSVETAEDGSLIVEQSGETHRYFPVDDASDVFVNALGHTIHFQHDSTGAIVAVNDGSGVHSHERIAARGQPLALFLPFLLALGLSLTTLLGGWKRWAQAEATRAGRRAAWRAWAAAIGVLIYTVLGVVAVVAASQIDASTIKDFPPTPVVVFSAAGWGLLGITAILLTGLVPAWRGSEWPIRRRLHYTVFALTLPVLCAQLWYWNLFGAAIV